MASKYFKAEATGNHMVRIWWGQIRKLTSDMEAVDYDTEDAEAIIEELQDAANKIHNAIGDVRKIANESSPQSFFDYTAGKILLSRSKVRFIEEMAKGGGFVKGVSFVYYNKTTVRYYFVCKGDDGNGYLEGATHRIHLFDGKIVHIENLV